MSRRGVRLTEEGRASLQRFVLGERRRLQISQRQLAEAAGISRQTMGAIETGQLSTPTLLTLSRLAMALEVPVDHLLDLARIELDAPPELPVRHGAVIDSAIELLQAMPIERQHLTLRLLLVLADQDVR